MPLAAGPLTSFITSLAAAVGAGVVLGGFAAGVVAFALGMGVERDAKAVRAGGYCDGLFALLAVVADGMR